MTAAVAPEKPELPRGPGTPKKNGAAGTASLRSVARNYVDRVRGGELGALPAVLGLIVLCVFFAALRPVFLSELNFANLLTQGAGSIAIAMGLVFVLLLGEIDLSAGYASGVCAAVLAILLTDHGWPWYGAAGAAILTGTVIGLVLGLLVAKVGIPSFVVTLAAFLGFQGIVLMLLKEGTNISIRDETILAVANNNLSPALGWVLLAVSVGAYAAIQLRQNRNRRRRRLAPAPLTLLAVRIGGLAVLGAIAVHLLNQERSRNIIVDSLKGVPIVVPVIATLLVAGTFLLQRTSFGLHIYAVGGNAEAARRAGINVAAIRISAFVICSALAAVGGIIAASRGNSVDPNTGGSNVLLLAVGAAVIGGTSLFGGRGRVVDAVLGGMVVAVIQNGMGLMGYSSGVKYAVTGSVLLVAAGVDALSRRRAVQR
ncbi:D-xylose transport system permease protein [Streptomyces phaeochromogenes]|jgi:D-xylose transport system permease protein|uniref:Xylose transport system permease protein XylH n=1 Tax=Streptomyces phaeochromogenes TaxID=1923 RepID=A0ABZ1H0D5_STRPH|nr:MULTISPECIES: ABC transporter permease [Streptomyces]MDQ0946772.1 D-xylose transport system permease protein [Streptomyces phaeochromogenes]WRZ26349.1 ABC transporter permease [Streptomyces phaeochromogenes]WSD11880.1 ABC transporter permease [Streptomyces phaeochromogenes]WSJ11285.1 ABC transporter permease [Streptomyces phaeochromogenes]WSS90581.1 ABC transporter permease [Streptomyces phaeochromogenes]